MSEQITPNPSVPTQIVADGLKFPKFVNNLGIIPTSYKDSMDYYENLAWLCKYLEETVIPTVNQNGNAVQELQNLYIELNSYVAHYFDNLDVQEEINNKLDNMVESGELQELINLQYYELKTEVNNSISEFETEVNNSLTEIRDNVQSLASGSPIPVSSTSEMTDTTKIYVNTTDGKWYFYNTANSTWTIGGTYQSSGISDNSIDILMLDNKLKSNFFNFYGNYIDKGQGFQGFVTRTGLITDTAGYIYYPIALTSGKIYTYSGYNVSQLCGLVVMDSSHNVIYAAGTQAETKFVSLIFRVNQNGLTAYLSYRQNEITNKTNLNYYTSGLRELTNIYNNLKYTSSIPLIEEIEGKYLASNSITLGENTTDIILGQINNGITKIYQLTNGRKYHFTGYNYASVCGLCIIGLDRYVYYASSTQSGVAQESFEYTYEATSDGFIILSTANPSEMPFSIELIEEGVEVNYETNKLNGLKLGADGDSIMHGNENGNVSYATLIAANNNMTLDNKAIGGGTIASGTYHGQTARHWICQSVLTINQNCDIIIVNGGVNDYWNSVPLGTLTPDYTSTVDSTTFYGGLETLFRNLLSRFPNKKIAFVTNHNINNILTQNNNLNLKFRNYYEAIIETAEKYSIPVIDLHKNSQLNTGILSFKSYTVNSDGVHPTTEGYNLFYIPYVTNSLKNLL